MKEIHGKNVPEPKNIAPVKIGIKQENVQSPKKDEIKKVKEEVV